MKKRYWFLLVMSAVLYAVPFWYSNYLWWLIFIFPIPFLYVACQERISFKAGVVWAGVTLLLHLSGGICVVMRMSHGYWWLGALFSLIVLSYLIIFFGLLCWLAQFMVLTGFLKNSLLRTIVMYAGVLTVFVLWIDQYCLCIFDRIEGYGLMHPFILLTHCPALLLLLPWIGKFSMTLLFFLLSGACAALLLSKDKRSLVFFVLTVMPWLFSLGISNFQHTSNDVADVSSVIAIARMTSCKSLYPRNMMRVMGQFFSAVIKDNPQTRVIVFPESAFDSELFSQNPELFEWWGQEHIGQPIHIVFGGVRTGEGCCYNSLYWIDNGALRGFFDKRQTMLLSERLPRVLDGSFVRSVYLSNCPKVTCGTNDRCLLQLGDMGEWVPYLCSELFFNEYPDDTEKNGSIIALINDSVFQQHSFSVYLQEVLVLLARFKAIMWQRDIVYVSYAKAIFFSKKGQKTMITQV